MDIIQIPTTQTPGAGLGDVVGPASSTDNAIVRYDTTTGRLLQNSTVTIADSGDVSISSTTAGASGAGALVVQGGISAGQSAQASFIGGNLTVGAQTGALSLPDKPDSLIMSLGYPATSTPTNQQLKISLGNVSGTEAYGFTTDNIARVWYHAGNSSSGSGGHVLATGGTARLTIDGTTATFAGAVAIGGNVGFYNASPVAKPTGVAVTAAAIHAALVTLNLIAA